MRSPSRSFSLVVLFTVVCAAGVPPSLAQVPRLVRDLNTAGDGSGAFPQAELDGYIYLMATDPDHGSELWKTDGTAEGTTLVKDVRPGPASSGSFYVANAGGVIFFAPDTEEYGRELWKTDGTAAGTVLVKDILPGPATSFPERFAVVGDTLFFVARDKKLASELWKSDGTEAGTVMVKDISKGDRCCGANPLRLTPSGNRLFFRADDGVHGDELWVSDGTQAGTRLVKDIDPGKGGSRPDQLLDLEGTLYFAASNRKLGEELWRSDGTEAGTVLVQDIWPGPRSSFPYSLAVVGDLIFFSAEDPTHGAELRTADRSGEGTVLVLDMRPGDASGGAFRITDVGGTAFFFAHNPGEDFDEIWELWTSDGTEAGTRMVRAVAPDNLGSTDQSSLEYNGELVFSGEDAARGTELWRSDGTEAGTGPIKDIFPGEAESRPAALMRLGDRILFSAEDGVHGRELWSTDGTAAGTALLRDINFKGTVDSSPMGVAELDGVLYFAANEPSTGWELWRSDGTAAGTFVVRDIDPDGNGLELPWDPDIVTAGGKLFFFADDGVHGRELWTSDGTRTSTRMVKDLLPPDSDSEPFYLQPTDRDVYFSGYIGGKSLFWRSDGTEEGTFVIHEDRRITAESLGSLGGLVFYARGDELWRSDGTESGTFAVATVDFSGIKGSTAGEFLALDEVLLFAPGDSYSTGIDRELWRTDGTRAGTYILKDIAPGPASSDPGGLIAHEGLVFFRADDGVHGVELWQTDGTAAGTEMVADLSPGPASSSLWPLDSVNGSLFLAGATTGGAKSGRRNGLWSTRGIGGGIRFITAKVQPLFEPAKAFGNQLYFSNRHPVGLTFGTELWRSDGTAKGTKLVADINPGSRDSSPSDYTVVGRNLFFSATSGRYGRELWVVGAGTSTGSPGGVTSVPDLDGLGGDEVAALFSNVVIRDAATGDEIASAPLAPEDGWEAVDFETLSDVNGNDSAELAILTRKRNRVRVYIRDALSGDLLATVRLQRNRQPLDLEIFQGDSQARLAILTRRGLAGRSGLTLRSLFDATDLDTGDLDLGDLDIGLPDDFAAVDLEIAARLERGGSPILVVLGQSSPRNRARLLALDPTTGLLEADWMLPDGLIPVDLEIVQSGPKAPGRAAVLLENQATGAVRVLTIDLESGTTLRTVRFGSKYRPVDLEPEPGDTGSVGAAVSLLKVSRKARSKGKVRVSTRNAFSGRKLGTATYHGMQLALDLALVRDVDGSGSFEAAVLGEAECAEGSTAIVLRDASTGSRLGCHAVP